MLKKAVLQKKKTRYFIVFGQVNESNESNQLQERSFSMYIPYKVQQSDVQ